MMPAPFFAWDVSTILFFVLVFFFLVIVIDKFFIKSDSQVLPKKTNAKVKAVLYFLLFLKYKKDSDENKPFLIRTALSFYPVILLVFAIRTFMFEPFQIPSNSMMPNLLTGDFLLVDKHSYGLRFPLTNTKFIAVSKPKRGDIIVFRYPNYEQSKEQKGRDYIKRLIAIPGDRVKYIGHKLFINGTKADYKIIDIYKGLKSGKEMTGFPYKKEIISKDKSYSILFNPRENRCTTNKPYYFGGTPKTLKDCVEITVPKGMYFVMGDNRDNSADSRFWGFVPEDYIIGEAIVIWFHWDFTFFDLSWSDFSWWKDFSWSETFKVNRWFTSLN
jgi:signal peptidase I